MQTSYKPMVTVFTSCHNQGKYLKECIESVLWQSYDNFEYLLYDDGSTDDTLDIIRYYASVDNRIKVKSLPKQKNVGVLINQSFRDANGSYLCWCPSDDVLMDTLLERKMTYAKTFPDSIIYDNWLVIDDKGKLVHTVDVKPMSPDEFNQEVWHSSPIGFTGIWIPVAIGRALPFPEHLHFSEDFYWMIKTTIEGVQYRGIPERLHYKRKHIDATTARNIDAILDQIPRIRQELAEYREWRLKNVT